jgi:hypothetical protein
MLIPGRRERGGSARNRTAESGLDGRGPITGPVPGLRSGAGKRNVLVVLLYLLGGLLGFGLFVGLFRILAGA